MATYSLAVTGTRADSSPYAVNNVVLADTVSQSVGDQQNAMQLNTPFLCKNPDGSFSWYVLDAERSIPGVNRVLRPVDP